MSGGTLREGLRLAVGTLTVLSSGPVITTRPVAGAAMTLAPLAVLPLALAVLAVAAAGSALALPPLATATVVVALLAAGTRAMHLDGLADTVDGLGGGWTRERALEIMRTGDVGPMGVVALVLTLLLQVTCAAHLLGGPHLGPLPAGALALAAAIPLSRAACPLLCRRGVPAAAPTGLGATVAGTVPTAAAVAAVALPTALLALAATPAGPVRGPLAALGAAALATATTLSLAALARRRLGGMSGDVIGAAVELALASVLLVLAGTLR